MTMPFAILAQSGGGLWMPPKASTHAGDVDFLFHFILWLSVFFFLLVTALVVVFVWKYHHREGVKHEATADHSTALELTWTLIPTVLVCIIFYFGFRGYLQMGVIPSNAYEIQVEGRMWSWQFTYPNGHVDPELHVPANTPVRLVLSSADVIHSLYIPAFRVKKDAVPGRYNKTWFEATELGTFDLYCAEYCGTNHSTMITKVVVHEPSDFKVWLEKASNWETRMTPVEAGKMLITSRGCTVCHSETGNVLIGPSFKNLFGYERQFTDGSRTVADENYIRESIAEPGKRVVSGFANAMPAFQLKDQDMRAIIAYLKSLSDKAPAEATPGGAESGPSTTQPTMPAK